jgi:two-component system cell cycle sensor histidine kinase/response regulator CckA
MILLRPAASESGAGASFGILLQRTNGDGPGSTPGPARTPRPAASGPSTPEDNRPQGTILLVEDDEPLRTTYAEVLGAHGWEVLVASDGFNALIQAGAHRGRIDLLVSDLLLPQMSGIELWRRLSRFRPEARVLFISGNLEQARLLVDRGADTARLLGKPFTPRALLDTVRAILADSPFMRGEPPATA